MVRPLLQEGFLTIWSCVLLGIDPSTYREVSITSQHSEVQACVPVSSSSTKFQHSLAALCFCTDDIYFIVVKCIQNALSSPLTCITLCAKHPHSGAATTAVLFMTCCLLSPWRICLHSPTAFPGPVIPKKGFPPLVTVVKCPGKNNSVEKGFIFAQQLFYVQSIVTEVRPVGTWWHYVLQSKEQWCMGAGARLDFSTYMAQAPPTIKIDLPVSIGIIKIPPRKFQRLSSQGILDSVRLTTLTKHHLYPLSTQGSYTNPF